MKRRVRLTVFSVALPLAVIAVADGATFKKFVYMGKEYQGEVVEVRPATVKMRSPDGSTGVVPIDRLDLEFAAGLPIENNPYAKLLDYERRYGKGDSKAQDEARQTAKPEPERKAARPLGLPAKSVGDAEIELVSVKVAPVAFLDMFRDEKRTAEPHLVFHLRIRNKNDKKILQYSTWRGKTLTVNRDFGLVQDDVGNTYKRIDFSTSMNKLKGGVQRSESIYPGKTVDDFLVFQVPVDVAKKLTLDLPGDNVGGKGGIQFEVPMSSIVR